MVEPGDEVVVFQPVYDSYLPIIRQAGGIPRLVRLEPPHWRLTEETLQSVFKHKTKAVLFNNPLNPAAVVYPREDLELLARFCQEFDAVAICDEVWEHVIFDGREHIPLITIPGMRDRTIKVGSAGKIFSLTGWKIGFVCAAPPLLRVAAKVHQFLTFTTAPNLQAAVAYGLGKPADYFLDMRKELARSRDRLTDGLESIGFPVLRSQGTYFLTVDLSPLGLNETDEAFCKRIVTDYKVAAIPVSAFYEKDAVTSVVRFCFAKKDATLDTALERLVGRGASPIRGRRDARPDLIRPFAVAIAAALAAFALPRRAAQERTVNFYNWSNYMAPGVLEDFTKETGIKVVYDTFDANETLETRLLAGKSGYDVVVPTAYFLQRQITAKVFSRSSTSRNCRTSSTPGRR